MLAAAAPLGTMISPRRLEQAWTACSIEGVLVPTDRRSGDHTHRAPPGSAGLSGKTRQRLIHSCTIAEMEQTFGRDRNTPTTLPTPDTVCTHSMLGISPIGDRNPILRSPPLALPFPALLFVPN